MDEKLEKEEFEKVWDNENPTPEDEWWLALKAICFKWYLAGRQAGEEEREKLRKEVKSLHDILAEGVYIRTPVGGEAK